MDGATSGAAAPRFTVLTAAYNSQALLAEAVGSVLAQTLGDFEHVIVDDGSTDGTLELARSLARTDPRIRVFTRPNGGAGAARNTGLAEARGEWVTILDHDDLFEPTHLEEQARFIEAHPGYDIYSCNATYMMPSGLRIPVWRGPAYARVRHYTLEDILRRNRIFIMATLRTSVVRAAGGFREVRFSEDYDLWLRLLAGGARHIYNPARLGLYRLTPGAASTREEEVALMHTEACTALLDRDDLTPRRRAAIRAAIVRGGQRVEIARLRARIAAGDTRRARRTYLANRGGPGSPWQRWLGPALMVVHPALYELVFMRRR